MTVTIRSIRLPDGTTLTPSRWTPFAASVRAGTYNSAYFCHGATEVLFNGVARSPAPDYDLDVIGASLVIHVAGRVEYVASLLAIPRVTGTPLMYQPFLLGAGEELQISTIGTVCLYGMARVNNN